MRDKTEKELILNWDIRSRNVRLVGDNLNKIVSHKEAMQMAYDQEVDLIQVDGSKEPPICKLMDYGKYKYHLSKNTKTNKVKEDKEIRLRAVTDKHDLDVKISKVKDLLAEGHKVIITMQFHGREMAYVTQGADMMKNLVESMKEYAKIDQPLKQDDRKIFVKLAPVKNGTN